MGQIEDNEERTHMFQEYSKIPTVIPADRTDRKFYKSGTVRQYYATICVNLMTFAYGAAIGWPSPTIPLLQSKESPLESGPLTKEESSWITSILYAAGCITCLSCGYIAEKFGRKISLLTIGVPAGLSWLLIAFASNPWYLVASRFLCGLSGGLFHTLPIFVSEISETRIRGFLGSILMFSCNFGTLYGYILGAYLDYRVVAWVVIPFLIVFLSTVAFLPDTPSYYLMKQNEEDAMKSLKYYRGVSTNVNVKIEQELNNIKSNINRMQEISSTLTYKDFTTKAAKKAVAFTAILMLMRNLCGPISMLNYTATIFALSGSSLSPNLSSIIVAFVQILGSLCSVLLVERTGRKFLLIVSLLGCALGLSVLGSYTYLKSNNVEFIMGENLKWIPLVSFSFVMFISNWGYMTIMFLYIAEVTPQKIKGYVYSVCLTISWALTFAVVRYTAPVMEALDVHGTMFLFASVSVVGAIIVIFYFPETKGKTFEEISQILENKKCNKNNDGENVIDTKL